MSYVTTTDTCSNCGAKLENAETSRLEYQGEAYKLSQQLRSTLEFLKYNRRRMLEYGLTVVEIGDQIDRIEKLL